MLLKMMLVEFRFEDSVARFSIEVFAVTPANDNDPSQSEREEMEEFLDKYDK